MSHGTSTPEAKRLDLKKANQALVRLEKKGINFEIIVDPKLAFQYIKSIRYKEEDDPEVNIQVLEILAIDFIYTEALRGEKATESDLEYAFDTTNEIEVAKKILEEGELQLTQEQRYELAENKRRRIITFIANNAVDPKTGYPHPLARIENAIEFGNIRIDPYKSVDSQIKTVIQKLKEHLPLKLEQVKVAVRMQAEYGAKAIGVIKRFGDVNKQEWTSDGNWIGVYTVPAGRQLEIMDALSKMTKGRAEFKVIDRTSM